MNDQPALYNMGSITQKQSLYQVKIGYSNDIEWINHIHSKKAKICGPWGLEELDLYPFPYLLNSG